MPNLVLRTYETIHNISYNKADASWSQMRFTGK
jgi:hypothetical protein